MDTTRPGFRMNELFACELFIHLLWLAVEVRLSSSIMATSCFAALSSSSLVPNNKTSITAPQTAKPLGSSPLVNSISFRYSGLFSPSLPHSYGSTKKKKARDCSVLAVANEEVVVGAEIDTEGDEHDDVLAQDTGNRSRPCELYVCNLPRSCGISQLLEMFKPLGTVLSVEVYN